MCEIINEYVVYGIIDCVVSFSIMASILIRIYSIIRGYSFDRGMFCYHHIKTNFFKKMYMDKYTLNHIYMKFLRQIISPKILSYEAKLIESDDRYLKLSIGLRRYVWTYHKSVIIDKKPFLIQHNLVPVVDTFDLPQKLTKNSKPLSVVVPTDNTYIDI